MSTPGNSVTSPTSSSLTILTKRLLPLQRIPFDEIPPESPIIPIVETRPLALAIKKRTPITTTPEPNVDQQSAISEDLMHYMKGTFDLNKTDHLDLNGDPSRMFQDHSIFSLRDLSKLSYFAFLKWEQAEYETTTWYFAIKDMV